MKFVKILILLLILGVSNTYAQSEDIFKSFETSSAVEVATTSATDNTITASTTPNIVIEEPTMQDKFFSALMTFVSYALLAFCLCWVFPNFTKKTAKIFVETSKFKLFLEGVKVIFIGVSAGAILVFIGVGISMGAFFLSLTFATFLLGIPFFSISVLEWLFAKKKIKFEKLTRVNQFTSILSIHIILMVIALPFLFFIPEYTSNYNGMELKIGIAYPLIVAFMSTLGMGALSLHLQELFSKNRKKL